MWHYPTSNCHSFLCLSFSCGTRLGERCIYKYIQSGLRGTITGVDGSYQPGWKRPRQVQLIIALSECHIDSAVALRAHPLR